MSIASLEMRITTSQRLGSQFYFHPWAEILEKLSKQNLLTQHRFREREVDQIQEFFIYFS